MSKTKKTREQIVNQIYVSQEDIRRLFQIGYDKSKDLYRMCDEVENEELGKWRYEHRKVRMNTLLKISQVSLDQLRTQIKNAD